MGASTVIKAPVKLVCKSNVMSKKNLSRFSHVQRDLSNLTQQYFAPCSHYLSARRLMALLRHMLNNCDSINRGRLPSVITFLRNFPSFYREQMAKLKLKKKEEQEEKLLMAARENLARERAEWREAHPAYQGGRIS